MSNKADIDMDIDFDAISRRYEEERAKRMRDEGNDQFIEIRTKAPDYDVDPNADPAFERAPVVEDVDALVIGAGVSGLLAAARMREAGVESLRIVEKGADFGGTWYWNRYPGLHCDVESYIYMPMIEELGVMPTEKYANGAEIRAHLQRVGKHYDLYSGALFQTEVESTRWDEGRRRWIVKTSRGDRIAARFVISGTGFLSNPKLARIPGIDSFAGHSFHTSRWDFDYTGGNEFGGMDKLKDKVVGLIGTGATSVQLIPHLQKAAKQLYVFQRTPSAVDVRGNGPTDVEWFKSMQPGWTRIRSDNFATILSGGKVDEKLIDDGWTDILPQIDLDDPEVANDPMAFAKAAMRKMERIRQRVDGLVKDKATAEALKPWYHFGCKRPTFHDAYLEVYNEPNIRLVDTEGRGVDRITPQGVVANGEEFELDCLIYATGYDYNADYSKENGIDFEGRDGLHLSKHWEDGPRTLYGLQSHGFPNLFFMRVAQTGAAGNFTSLADEQARHIAFMVSESLKRGIGSLEPTSAAEEAWVDEIVSNAGPRLAFFQSCTPGYYNQEGKVSDKLARFELYSRGPVAYNSLLEEWRREGDLRGYDVQYL